MIQLNTRRFHFCAEPADTQNYVRAANGVIRRRIPKRDKSLSARQWKKRVKAARAVRRQEQLKAQEEAA